MEAGAFDDRVQAVPVSFAATAATAGNTASARLANLVIMPPGTGPSESSQAVSETFASLAD